MTPIKAALVPRKQPTTLKQYNFSVFNGLKSESPALHLSYPNLRAVAALTVDTLDPAQLERVMPAAGDDNSDYLLVDRFGDSIEVLDALDEKGLLERFSVILVRTLADKTCDEANNASAVETWFAGRFFHSPLWLEEPNSAFNLLAFRRDEIGRQAGALKSTIEDRDNAISSLESQLAAAKSDLRDLQSQYSKLKAQYDDQVSILEQVNTGLRNAVLLAADSGDDRGSNQ
ncbi:MAG: hypothetical protein KAH44_31935 [Oricola sp.]|nr:hypothetical protein [Oricola sp.]